MFPSFSRSFSKRLFPILLPDKLQKCKRKKVFSHTLNCLKVSNSMAWSSDWPNMLIIDIFQNSAKNIYSLVKMYLYILCPFPGLFVPDWQPTTTFMFEIRTIRIYPCLILLILVYLFKRKLFSFVCFMTIFVEWYRIANKSKKENQNTNHFIM